MSDRLDFRVARLERRVFGTATPTAGTASGVTLTTKDMITRIVDLESQIGSALPLLATSGMPLNTVGTNGQWAYDAVEEHVYVKLGGTWRQIQ